ncbi:hypothetical protein MNBD_GAMMA10-2060 [hydrothermal vent metagenome]|uniref:PqqD family protein n=1 Tax=hydrothermal vent metagenome TaxID=652676 RepID=A0A3B0X9N8_9ZZZZ
MKDDTCMPMQKQGMISQLVDGEVLILNNQGAEVHQLNEVASLIWSYCDGAHSIDSIALLLLEKYAVSEMQAAKDTAQTVSQFKEKGLLESVDR